MKWLSRAFGGGRRAPREVAEGRASATTSELAMVNSEISELETVKSELETILVESAVEQYVSGQERGQGTVLSAEDPVVVDRQVSDRKPVPSSG